MFGEAADGLAPALDGFTAAMQPGVETVDEMWDQSGFREVAAGVQAGLVTIDDFGQRPVDVIARSVAFAADSEQPEDDGVPERFVAALVAFLQRPNAYPLLTPRRPPP